MLFNEQTKQIINSIIGDFEVIHNHRGNSDRTGVLEITANGERYFVKIYNRLSHWHAEVFAYKNWMEDIQGMVPVLVSSFKQDDILGIITTPIAGKTVNEMNLEDDTKLKNIYFEAGKLYKKLQNGYKGSFFGIPKIDGSPYGKCTTSSSVEYICNSMESIFKAGYDKHLFDSSHEALFDFCLKNSTAFVEDYPCPTNWDFSQNNWMIDENGEFTGFIDFENMLWGLPLDSFGVIIERYTFDKPYLKEAFFKGYGLNNDELTKIKIEILSIKMAMADIYNGYTNNHPRFFECGQRLLNSIMKNYAK